MAGGAVNQKIDPVNVLWRIESEFTVDFSTTSASGFGGTSFTFFSAKDATQYYCWGDENSTDVDPAETGTGIEVDYAAGASTTVIAAAAQVAIDALGDFSASVSGSVVTVKNAVVGKSTDVVDTDSGVTVNVCRRGKDFDLGLLEGDVELSVAPSNLVVTSHQSGVTPRAALFQGFETLEVTTTMQETDNSNLKEIYGIYGTDGFTPGGGTEVFGGGSSKQGANLLIDAARLELKPVNAVNDTTNTTLMLAIPTPDTLLFSGENLKTLAITWQGFLDDTKDSRVSALLFGDPGQSGL